MENSFQIFINIFIYLSHWYKYIHKNIYFPKTIWKHSHIPFVNNINIFQITFINRYFPNPFRKTFSYTCINSVNKITNKFHNIYFPNLSHLFTNPFTNQFIVGILFIKSSLNFMSLGNIPQAYHHFPISNEDYPSINNEVGQVHEFPWLDEHS